MICRFAVRIALILIGYTPAALSGEPTSKWHLGASAGVVDFVSPERSASTISDPRIGGALSLFAIQRPLAFLGIGCRGELLFVPSKERDADATFGGRAMLVLRAAVPLGKFELHISPETGYSFLGRRVAFENTDRVSFQGATVGLAIGVDVALHSRLTLGAVARVNQVLGTLTCTSRRCHTPQKGRNPGPALFLGIGVGFTP